MRTSKPNRPLLWVAAITLTTFTELCVTAAEAVLVRDGCAEHVQYVGGAWKQEKGRLVGQSDRSRLLSSQQITGTNFHVRALLTLPKLSRRNPELGLGRSSYLQLDANGGRFILGGPLFIPNEQMIRYTIVGKNDGLIKPGKPFLLEAVGKQGSVEFFIDGKSIHRHKLLGEDVGPVSLFPGTGELWVSEFTVAADSLQPYAPGNINSYGAELDPRLTWRPELRKANYVKLADGALAYLSGRNLMISRDGGQTWESRQGQVQSDRYPNEFSYSGALLLRTRDNVLIAVTINAKNSVHLKWDDEQQKAVAGRREVWTLRSTDEGRTWSDVQMIYGGYCGAMVNLIQTSNGNVVVPVQEFLFDRNTNITRTYVSSDDGKTWQKGNTLDIGDLGNHAGNFEPTIAQLSDGRVMMLMRTNLDYLWAAYSDAEGRFFRETRPSRFDASSSPAFLHQLDSGRLLLIWNRVAPEGQADYRRRIGKWSATPVSWCREEVSLSIGDPSGTEWTEPVVIAKKPGLWMAYPYVFEPQPGTVWLFASGGLRVEFNERDFLKP